jgi:hypothetical protein
VTLRHEETDHRPHGTIIDPLEHPGPLGSRIRLARRNRAPADGHTPGVREKVVAALYPVRRWFAEVKRRRHDRWLGYL